MDDQLLLILHPLAVWHHQVALTRPHQDRVCIFDALRLLKDEATAVLGREILGGFQFLNEFALRVSCVGFLSERVRVVDPEHLVEELLEDQHLQLYELERLAEDRLVVCGVSGGGFVEGGQGLLWCMFILVAQSSYTSIELV